MSASATKPASAVAATHATRRVQRPMPRVRCPASISLLAAIRRVDPVEGAVLLQHVEGLLPVSLLGRRRVLGHGEELVELLDRLAEHGHAFNAAGAPGVF